MPWFQSQARSQPSGDEMLPDDSTPIIDGFQSQARSQPSGDMTNTLRTIRNRVVSISSEKPTLWRQHMPDVLRPEVLGFNLKREANPLATGDLLHSISALAKFQSQARSQPSGDLNDDCFSSLIAVSISSEKPTLWRRAGGWLPAQEREMFQSQARSQPSGDTCHLN